MTGTPCSVDEAIHALLDALSPLPAAPTALSDALGMISAETVHAPFPLPQWSNSAMDGYAVRADDVRGAATMTPVELPVIAEIAAGDTTTRALAPGEAMRIFTGGRVPEGADSVIRQEDTDRGTERVVIVSDRDAMRNVRRLGSDLQAGAEALAAGTRIGPSEINLLAALAITAPLVHRRPRVAIISSGDEVARPGDVESVRAGSRLADSNTPALTALTTLAGGTATALGPVRDDPATLAATIRGACDVDLVLTVGGVSVGDHDHVPAVMSALGARVLFRRVTLRPGGPTTAAVLPDGRLWLALPGNPVSAMVTFTLFARPVLQRMAGESRPPVTRFVELATAVTRHATLDLYVRAMTIQERSDGVAVVTPIGGVGSAQMTSMRGANHLLRIPAGPGSAAAGSLVAAEAYP